MSNTGSVIIVVLNKNGFSLVEVIIGLVFLAIGLLAIAGMQTVAVRGNASSNNVMLATYAAQDGLEFLRNLPLNSPLLSPGANYGDTPKRLSTDSLTSLAFDRSYTVTSVNDPAGNYIRIDYLVKWNDGSNHTLRFYTIRSQ